MKARASTSKSELSLLQDFLKQQLLREELTWAVGFRCRLLSRRILQRQLISEH